MFLRRTVLFALLLPLLSGFLVAVALAPAQAATSSPPTTSTKAVVPKGSTIRVRVVDHGSKVVRSSTALFRGTKRVRDMSPPPGRYKARTAIRYRIKTTEWVDVWVPDADCADYSYDGYDENGDGDYDDENEYPPYDACAEGEYGSYESQRVVTYGDAQRVVRVNRVRVHYDRTPGCATFSEYKAVRKGMTQTRVKRIVGAKGHISYRYLSPHYSHISREFRVCNGDSYDSLNVDFYKYRPRATYKVGDKSWWDF